MWSLSQGPRALTRNWRVAVLLKWLLSGYAGKYDCVERSTVIRVGPEFSHVPVPTSKTNRLWPRYPPAIIGRKTGHDHDSFPRSLSERMGPATAFTCMCWQIRHSTTWALLTCLRMRSNFGCPRVLGMNGPYGTVWNNRKEICNLKTSTAGFSVS